MRSSLLVLVHLLGWSVGLPSLVALATWWSGGLAALRAGAPFLAGGMLCGLLRTMVIPSGAAAASWSVPRTRRIAQELELALGLWSNHGPVAEYRAETLRHVSAAQTLAGKSL